MIRAAARLAWRALKRFFQHSGPDRAAAVAYYTLLSLLPLLIFVISVGLFAFGSFEEAYRGTLFLFRGVVVHLDQDSLAALRAFAERAARFQWPGILLLAWTSRRIFGSLLSALETVFEVPGRGFAKGNLAALAMVLVTGVGMLATLAFTMLVAAFEGLLAREVARFTGAAGVHALHSLTAMLLTHLVPMLITMTFFFILYGSVPGRVVGARHAAVGAAVATLLWETAKAGFAYYVRSLAHYAGLYGALEGVIVLGLWLELSVSIILYGGEIVALLSSPGTGRGTEKTPR